MCLWRSSQRRSSSKKKGDEKYGVSETVQTNPCIPSGTSLTRDPEPISTTSTYQQHLAIESPTSCNATAESDNTALMKFKKQMIKFIHLSINRY